jgi:RHS repeat-associated protein
VLVYDGTTRFTQDLASPLTQILQTTQGSATTQYLYALDRLASVSGNTRTWYGADALGSVRLTLSDAGAIVDSTNYDPWGAVETRSAAQFGFAGEWHDIPNGLVNLRARWYSTARGRFNSVDPFAGVPEQPYSLHQYAYGLSDPVLMTDPAGTCATESGYRACRGEPSFGALIFNTLNEANIYWQAEAAAGRPDARYALFRLYDRYPQDALNYNPDTDPSLENLADRYGMDYYGILSEIKESLFGWRVDHAPSDQRLSNAALLAASAAFTMGPGPGAVCGENLGKGLPDIAIGPRAGNSAPLGSDVVPEPSSGGAGSGLSRSELTNSLSNLGENPATRNATVIAEYLPTPNKGTAFSGVYDPETGQFLLRPSGNTRLANGTVPENVVAPRGGHFVVNRQLGELAGGNTQRTVGFTVFYETEGELVVEWLSRSVNGINYQSDYAPQEFRQPIMEAIQRSTGLRVISR